jgi:uncharacterized membrane protein
MRRSIASKSISYARDMGMVLATTFGMVMWIVLWALFGKGFDAFLVTMAVLLVGASFRILARYLPGAARRE